MPRRRKPSGRHSGFGNTRPLNTLRRTPGKRVPLKRIIVVCEGAETEPRYFQALRQRYRLSTVSIQIVKGRGAPISVVEEAIRQKKKLDDKGDEVWCVFDVEVEANNPSFDEAVGIARSGRLGLAISNPAFEYWYILHFECTDRPFQNADDAVNRLRGHIPHYEKSISVFPALEERISVAIRNANQLRQRADEPWDTFPNPSTGVDRLVVEITKLVKPLC
jgi:hypothetical protein